MRQSGEARGCKSLGVTPSLRVFDLGCGDGTTALPLAHLGAESGWNRHCQEPCWTPGRKRAAESGSQSGWRFRREMRPTCMGVDDDSFDLTLTVFGAMFAPRAVRRGQGDGAGHKAGRPYRDG